jgi:uncharacterized protein YjiS (DUF1127 family)
MKKNKKELATRAELEKLSDQELKAITLERDEKKRFTKRANIAYEVQRERHHAQACIGSDDFYVNKTSSDTNWSVDSLYNGGYTD